MKKIIIIVGLILFTGCSLSRTKFTSFTIKEIEGVKVIEKGRKVGDCVFTQYNSTRIYAIKREKLSLFIILSNRTTPEIYLGAKDKNGNILKITSDGRHDNNPLPKDKTSIPFDNKIKNLYGISVVSRIQKKFNFIKLYLHNEKGDKVDDIKLEFELKPSSCIWIEMI